MKKQTFNKRDDLPNDFDEYLDNLPKFHTGGWELYSRNDLLEVINFNGIMVERWNLPNAFADFHNNIVTTKVKGYAASSETLSDMCTIGSLDGDYIFVGMNQVWFYHHENHCLELQSSWSDFLDKCVDLEVGLILPELVGEWLPMSSETENDEMFEYLCPRLELRSNSEAVQYVGVHKSELNWGVEGTKIHLKASNISLEYNFNLESNELDIRSVSGDYHCHYIKK